MIRYGVDTDAMPNATLATADPGPGSNTVSELDSLSLVPAQAQDAPNATTSFTLTLSMQNTADNLWRAFVNQTSWSPLMGDATLFARTGAQSQGAGVYQDSQLVITIPDEQVVDVVV